MITYRFIRLVKNNSYNYSFTSFICDCKEHQYSPRERKSERWKIHEHSRYEWGWDVQWFCALRRNMTHLSRHIWYQQHKITKYMHYWIKLYKKSSQWWNKNCKKALKNGKILKSQKCHTQIWSKTFKHQILRANVLQRGEHIIKIKN